MFDAFDAVLLARIQFAFTVSFHFIFPAFTIGLASYLMVLNGLWLWTRREVYLRLFRFWVKIFAVAFAMGVVSGIVMSYQFGTNWSVFSDRAGPVIGGPMAYEVLSAFFLEAGFLGVMLFGRDRVGPTLHMVSCVMVALGTAMSAFWILSVNSWMHTPSGYTIDPETGQFLPLDFWEIIFNPSFPYRFLHATTAAFLTTAFIVAGVGAWHLLRERRKRLAMGGPVAARDWHAMRGAAVMFSMAMWMALIVAPAQVVIGDAHGLNTLEYQPAKVAAMEGHYRDYPEGAPLYLFGIPDDEAQTLRYAVGIPGLSSLILKHDADAPLKGLESIPEAERPPVALVFYSFRIMVGIGMAMVGLALWAAWARWRGTLYTNVWLLRSAVVLGPSGLVAVIAGWIVTEVGRQPYTIYGLMTTSESASDLDAGTVGLSLTLFVLVYFAVFGAGIFYILRLMAKPVEPDESPLPGTAEGPIRTAGITPIPQGTPQRQGGHHGDTGAGATGRT